MSKQKPTKTHCLRGHPQTPGNARWNGRSWHCYVCLKVTEKAGRKRKKEADPFGVALAQLRRNANKRNQPFELTVMDFMVLPTHCPVLGMELDYSGGGGPNAASIDRIDSGLGYVRGNCAIISRRANTLKNNATTGELQKVLDYMRSRM